jgi:hypothetical protein
MDRRDALKKLGMGGATVVGASVILSSPAFAATGTAACAAQVGNPTISVTKTGNASQSQASITITYTGLGSIVCPCVGPATLVGSPDLWTFNGVSRSPGSSATWTGLGSGTFNYSFRLKVRCLDRGNVALCTYWTGGGTIAVDAGQSAPAVTGPSGSQAPTAC